MERCNSGDIPSPYMDELFWLHDMQLQDWLFLCYIKTANDSNSENSIFFLFFVLAYAATNSPYFQILHYSIYAINV
jgi:hypothetical protein